MNNPSGNCEVCGTPTENLYLDSGVWKCSSCINSQYLPNNSAQATRTTERGVLK